MCLNLEQKIYVQICALFALYIHITLPLHTKLNNFNSWNSIIWFGRRGKKDGLGNAIAISTEGDIPPYPQPYTPPHPPGRQEGPSEYAVQGAQNP